MLLKMNDVKILGFEQLQFILQKIGTPDDEVIDRIPSEKVLSYLFNTMLKRNMYFSLAHILGDCQNTQK